MARKVRSVDGVGPIAHLEKEDIRQAQVGVRIDNPVERGDPRHVGCIRSSTVSLFADNIFRPDEQFASKSLLIQTKHLLWIHSYP